MRPKFTYLVAWKNGSYVWATSLASARLHAHNYRVDYPELAAGVRILKYAFASEVK